MHLGGQKTWPFPNLNDPFLHQSAPPSYTNSPSLLLLPCLPPAPIVSADLSQPVDASNMEDMQELISFLFDEADAPRSILSPSPISPGLHHPKTMLLERQPNSCLDMEHKQPSSSSSSSSSFSSSSWAGPTLLDLQSALRMRQQQHLQKSSSMSSCTSIDSSDDEPKPTSSTISKTQKQTWIWRKPKKGRDMEPRHVLRIRSESNVVEDGYKWRKYGQKGFKYSPYPRSYYRCTSSKCGAKKQVERSREEPGILIVKYEGLHLHHRPYPFISSSSITDVSQVVLVEKAESSCPSPHLFKKMV